MELPSPSPPSLLLPLLASLPAAAVSPQPPTALLPLLSPILRQRVQLLSSASNEPWLPLLSYSSSAASALTKIAQTDRFEPHPVSGEIEVDWDSGVAIRYKRVDEETLQSLILLSDFDIAAKLVWCMGDAEGGADGWRIGEVSVLDSELERWGATSIVGAESVYQSESSKTVLSDGSWHAVEKPQEEEEDDDYWAQYDNTPAHTPAVEDHSQAPAALRGNPSPPPPQGSDEAYFAQYAQVQPALDDHDPDEARENGAVESSLGRDEISHELRADLQRDDDESRVLSPRPSSSSSGEVTVSKLEREAERRGSSEVAVAQHISTSVKSLYRLARAAGMPRAEFDALVSRELEVLGMMDEDEL